MTESAPTAASSWLAHLSLRRIITSNRFIPEVDGFRFLAIFIVAISHVYAQGDPNLGEGSFGRLFFRAFFDGRHGVYLFFTISGFILALPFARHHLEGGKPVAIGSYFKRRITRLEPPYVIAMLIRAVMILRIKQTALAVVGLHLLASLLYIHSFVYGQPSSINPPAWSLEIEIQFYILAPFLASVFLIRSVPLRRSVLVGATLLSGLFALTFISSNSPLALSLLYHFQYFAAGFLLCDFYLSKTHFSIPPLVWDLIAVAALCWILLSHNRLYYVIFPFVTLGLYMAGFYGKIVRGFFRIPAISTIGGMCYSIYLTHTAVLTGVHGLLAHTAIVRMSLALQAGIIYPLCFALILAVGTVYFILIERPCMDPNWPHKLADWLFRRNRQPA
jgi:peptidoglycan/LPS O-acetylase OafA/YrhL